MNKYDHIIEMEKGIDEIVEVEKFNPFHDAAGKFSSSNGFKTYSANPNTKAGAMAIARSAAAGHGTTFNAHRESYGETIRQNANWLGHHNQGVGPRQTGSGTLRQRVEPKSGLAGASAHGYTWAVQNRINNRTTGRNQPKNPQQQKQPQKPAQQPATQQPTQPKATPQKPTQQAQQQQGTSAQSLASTVSGVYLSSGDKLAMQQRNARGHTTTSITNVAKAHDQARVAGRDMSASIDVRKMPGRKDPIDKIAEAQGWNKAPTVTDDLATFQKAAKQSGCMIIRTVHGNYSTGESAKSVCKTTMTDGNAPLGGTGMKAYGTGMYVVKTDFQKATGRNLTKRIVGGQQESYGYGDTQMMATLHPNAKVATPVQANQMKWDYMNMPASKRARYGDWGGYIASKGYDAAQWHDSSDPGAYATVYNKSALIFYSGVSDG